MSHLTAPLTVDINLTRRCNLSCSFCSAVPVGVSDRHARSQELTPSQLRRLFYEIEQMGVFYVRLAGGEPLVRSDIWQILDDLSHHSFLKVVLTNGVPLTKRMCQALKSTGKVTVGISLDGYTAETHDMHRGVVGTFRRVMLNLDNLRAVNLPFAAQSVVTKYNMSDMPRMVDFCQSAGFSGLKFILLNYSGNARSTSHFFPTWTQWSKAILDLTTYLRETRPSIEVSLLPPHEDPVPYELFLPLQKAGRLSELESVWGINSEMMSATGKIGCAAGRSQMTVFEDGSVYGCDLMRDNPEWCAGSVHSMSLREIWDTSPVFSRLRAMHKADLEGHCSGCDYKGCGGGCRASAFNFHRRFNASDSGCLLLK